MEGLDDVALVAAAKTGGPEAFGPIVRRYQDAVFAVALARLGDFHEAEDVTQNVLVEAYQRLEALKEPGRLGAWLRSMAIHKAIDVVRRRQASPVARAREISEVLAAKQDRRKELREEVMAAIGKLSKTQRETTTLFYINGYSMQEVAGIQEVPLGTVKRRLHEARAKLKQEMMAMVEGVLKSEAPDEDAAKRVYELLCQGGRDWRWTVEELRRIGPAGVQGFARAAASPNSAVRSGAMNLLTNVGMAGEAMKIAQAGLSDPNRKVRRFAAEVLREKGEKNAGERGALTAMLVPLLRDPTRRVRRTVAWILTTWAQYVPLQDAALALANEKDRHTRERLAGLVHAIVAARCRERTHN